MAHVRRCHHVVLYCVVLCCGGGRSDAAVNQLLFYVLLLRPLRPDCSIYTFVIYIFIYLIISLLASWLHRNHLSVFLPFF